MVLLCLCLQLVLMSPWLQQISYVKEKKAITIIKKKKKNSLQKVLHPSIRQCLVSVIINVASSCFLYTFFADVLHICVCLFQYSNWNSCSSCSLYIRIRLKFNQDKDSTAMPYRLTNHSVQYCVFCSHRRFPLAYWMRGWVDGVAIHNYATRFH